VDDEEQDWEGLGESGGEIGAEEEVKILGIAVVERGATEQFGNTAPPVNKVASMVGERVKVQVSRRVLWCVVVEKGREGARERGRRGRRGRGREGERERGREGERERSE
jgi:hypothetical protein